MIEIEGAIGEVLGITDSVLDDCVIVGRMSLVE